MSSPSTQIAIAVVEFEGKFLIGPRSSEQPLGGLWEFPGGKVELGEAGAAAAIRECREETGLHVEIVGEFGDSVYRYDHDSVRLSFFDCRPGQAALTPLPPFRWVERSSLGDYEFPAGNREVLAVLMSHSS